jgi:diguanylate cyclase (GGDEF)-like protein
MNRFGGLSVLLVEDDPQDAELVELSLREAGMNGRILRADQLNEARAMLEREKVDLVLLDLGLPGSTGLDTFRRFKEFSRDEPVVVLSGLSDEAVSAKAVHEGAQDYLVKGSFGPDLLRRSITHSIQRHNMSLELAALSLTDDLTGLSNRRGFMTLAGQMLKTARRIGEKVFVAFIDMDGMKRINDELGHEIGDQAIREAARILRDVFRDSDVLARLGGDEFAVFGLAGEGVSQDAILTRLEDNVCSANQSGCLPIALSFSLGLVLSDPEGKDLQDLLARADARMYANKRSKSAAR